MRKKQVFGLLFLVAFFLGFLVFDLVLAGDKEIIIAQNQSRTDVRAVPLRISAPSNATHMRIANDPNVNQSPWERVAAHVDWKLDFGAGTKTVYIQFRLDNGETTRIFKDVIILDIPNTITAEIEINDNDADTNTRYVTVSSTVSLGIETMQISNSTDFTGVSHIPVRHLRGWTLTENSGKKKVFVRFRDVNGEFHLVTDSIVYNEPERFINEGSVVRGPDSVLYYFGLDAKLHPYPSLAVYHSWFPSFSPVVQVSNAKLQQYQIGKPVSVRPGTWLVRFTGGKKIYIVEPGYRLREIRSEAEAFILYGKQWEDRVIELSDVQRSFYSVIDVGIDDDDVTDRDRDGIDRETERSHGSTDAKKDTDNDGLSDYEEIFYWFSDPRVRDTDGDGILDMDEVLRGDLPAGGGTISTIPGGTYVYPTGSFVQVVEGKRSSFEYYISAGEARRLGASKDVEGIVRNRLDKTFVIDSPFLITRPEPPREKITERTPVIKFPTTIIHDSVTQL